MSLLKKVLLNLAVFLALSLLGVGTAWYMIEAGSRLSTRSFGPWLTWSAAGRPDADPYTRAHTARNGLLPLTSTLELTFRAKADNSGGRLTSACDYAIVMEEFEPAWWGLAVFDDKGKLVANAADRHGFNSSTAMREPDGRRVIILARDARPGNWLPSGRSSKIILVLTVQDAAWAAAVHDGGAQKAMPEILRTGCR